MKRLFLAAFLAMLFHVTLLGVNTEWFFNKDIQPPQSQAVTVTMSYRRPTVIPAVKKAPLRRPKILEPKKIKVPQRPKTDPLMEAVEVPKEPEPSPAEVEEEASDVHVAEEVSEEEPDMEEEARGDAVSNMNVSHDATPLYKMNPPPVYPRAARNRGYQGTVVLSVHVDENGRVKNVWVFDSSGYRMLDNAALETIREKWIFKPGMRGNKKIAMWVKVPIRFELK